MKVIRKYEWPAIFILAAFFLSPVTVQAGTNSGLTNRLKSLETQIDQLAVSQKKAITAQNDIIQEIKRLKIWVNRHR